MFSIKNLSRLFPLLLIVSLYLCMGPIGYSKNGNAEAACVTQPATRTFIQPWRFYAQFSAEDWAKLFSGLRAHGFNEVIVQWSSYGEVSFFNDPRAGRESSPCLEALIRQAAKYQFKLWIGLHYDPAYWQKIVPPQGPAAYFRKRFQNLEQSLPLINDLIRKTDPRHGTVIGWYISDEIDDVNWRKPDQQTILLNYLQATVIRLRSTAPDFPILISGFANGEMSPQEWAMLWRRIFSTTNIRSFLFQDGIGVGKMTLAKLTPYLQTLNQTLDYPAAQLGSVVEIFRMAPPGTDMVTISAEFNRVRDQLSLARTYTHPPLTVFSAPDHLLGIGGGDTRALSAAWLQDRASCR